MKETDYKITVVGAPDSGKGAIVDKIHEHTNIPATSGPLPGESVTLGVMADYRTELYLASARAMIHRSPIIMWHSLIDSAAYVSLRLAGIVNVAPDDLQIRRWYTTLDVVLLMLMDGYNADYTLYLPYRGDDEDSRDIDGAIRDALTTIPIPHKEIDPDDEVDEWLST